MIAQLLPILALLCAGIAAVLFLPRFGISPIVGFLVTGLVFGDSGLGIVPHNDMIGVLAEMGVVFLLFDIGLHFSLHHVWAERRAIFLYGPLQVIITAGMLYLALQFFPLPRMMVAILALTLSLSSTAIASALLRERRLDGTPIANTTTAILIFQDVCAIFVLILAAGMGGDTPIGPMLAGAALKCAVSIAVAIVAGKLVVAPLLRLFARYDRGDAFTMIALFIVLLTSTATEHAGLSLTLGAFLAGMIIAETPFRHILQTEIKPFRNLLLGLFFVTVGISVDLHILAAQWKIMLALLCAISAIKFLSVWALFLVLRERTESALQYAALLFQGSEFVFVIIGLASVSAGLDAGLKGALVASVALSMAISSAVFEFVRGRIKRAIEMGCTDYRAQAEEAVTNDTRVLIIGMNMVGDTVARALDAHSIPYVVVENDYKSFVHASQNGFPVIYGDKADLRFWQSIGVEKYHTMIIAKPDIETSRMYASLPRENIPKLDRFIAVNDENAAAEFRTLNYAKVIINRSMPRGLELAEVVLNHLAADANAISDWLEKYQRQFLEARGPASPVSLPAVNVNEPVRAQA